jgi:histidine triad (HIT) family protein
MASCLFCKIIAGEIPSQKLFENDNVYCFLSIQPVNRGHALVVHKHHHADIFDTPEEDLKDLIVGAKHVAVAIQKAMKADGVNLGMNNRPAAGQVVMHAHLHLIPRFANDGFTHWRHRDSTPEELQVDADVIRKALK